MIQFSTVIIRLIKFLWASLQIIKTIKPHLDNIWNTNLKQGSKCHKICLSQTVMIVNIFSKIPQLMLTFNFFFQLTFDLYVWPWPCWGHRAPNFGCETIIMVKYFCHVIINSLNACRRFAMDKQFPLTSRCDLDIWHAELLFQL
jgi:hypothetical protein